MSVTTEPLTKEDLAILGLVCLPYKEIGARMGTTESCVKMHIHRLMTKLGVENRAALVVKIIVLELKLPSDMVYREFDNGGHDGNQN